jgi:hypothetical protein
VKISRSHTLGLVQMGNRSVAKVSYRVQIAEGNKRVVAEARISFRRPRKHLGTRKILMALVPREPATVRRGYRRHSANIKHRNG